MKKLSLLLLSLFVLLYSCNNYQTVLVDAHDFFENDQVQENYDDYNFYIHDRLSSYKFKNPKVEGKKITGELIELPEEEKRYFSEKPPKKKVNKDDTTAFDIHIFTKNPLGVYTASLDSFEFSGNDQPTTLLKEDISEVQVSANDGGSVALIIAVVILGIIAIIAITAWVISTTTRASSEGSNSSSEGSESSGGSSGSS